MQSLMTESHSHQGAFKWNNCKTVCRTTCVVLWNRFNCKHRRESVDLKCQNIVLNHLQWPELDRVGEAIPLFPCGDFPFPTSPHKTCKFLPPPAEFLEETVYISYKVQTYHVFILKFIYISWLHLFWLISFVSFLPENLTRVLVSY